MKTQSELTTLMIAWQIARVDGLNQAASIRKCARRLRDTTKDSVLYELFKTLIAAPEYKVVKCVSALHDKLAQDGLLYAK
ncbi:MAG TPA: hypothetical protein DDW91_17730 [Shewanella frigidimarina]|nr:hypothetical protein [Shewanella frigidimarina]